MGKEGARHEKIQGIIPQLRTRTATRMTVNTRAKTSSLACLMSKDLSHDPTCESSPIAVLDGQFALSECRCELTKVV